MQRRKHYPGTEGGPFHIILIALTYIERASAILIGGALALLALGVGGLLQALGAPLYTALAATLTLLAANAADWMLLLALPRAGRSFGPVHPPLLMLAGLRALANLVVGLFALAGLPGPAALGLMLAVQAGGAALAVHGFWREPQMLTVTRHTLTSPKLAPGPRPLRLVHLADIHMERITARDREVVRQVRALQPDVIVFTGDFLNLSRTHDRASWADLREILRGLEAPLGVYAVSGTPAVDPDSVVPHLVEGLNLRWLRDERVTIGTDGRQIEIVGMRCTHIPPDDAPRLQALLNGRAAANDRFTVLLYHSPDLAPDAAQLGIDLQLSGHTHGGQVRLPLYGALYSSSIYGKRFEMGLRQVDAMQIYVSRGLGLEGMGAPRVRFLCPPEIAVFEIDGTGSS